MRILVIVNVFRPDLGGGVLFSDLCDGLAERGHEVTVKCAYSYYPEWTDKSGRNGWSIEDATEGRLRVERHGIFIPRNPNSLPQRLVYEASFFLSLARRLPEHGAFDLVLVFCPLVGAVAYGVLAARRSRAPLWLNVQDLSAQAAAAGGLAGAASGVLTWIQNALFRRAPVWSTISEPMVRALSGIPGAPADVHLLPNWLHGSLAEHVRLLAHKRTACHNPVRLLYSGNTGSKQDLLSFCAYLHAVDWPFEFRIHTDGARAGELRDHIASWADPRFILAPLTDEAQLAQWLAWCDLYVITERAGAGSSFIPSKLIPALSSGAPILAVCDRGGPLGDEITRHGTGLLRTWTELEQHGLSPADFTELSTWSTNALTRSAFYSREEGIDRMDAFARRTTGLT
ncbi:MAG: glycosyltransferase [Rhodothermales bacterium]